MKLGRVLVQIEWAGSLKQNIKQCEGDGSVLLGLMML